MTQLTVTSKGQITLRKEVLQHLGVQSGAKVDVQLLPDGRVSLRAAQPPGSMQDFVGLLAGRSDKAVSIDEMTEAAARGWAGEAE